MLFIIIFLLLLLAWFGAPLFTLILSVAMIGFTYQEIDLTETNAIKAVFKNHSYQIPITSIKGACGSAMGTGGVHQLIATTLIMRNQLVPPTTNYIAKDPDCDLDYVLLNARKQKIRHALINTHGFGRSNGSMVLENIQ